MNTAAALEVFGASHSTSYANSAPQNAWGARLARELGATVHMLGRNGLALSGGGGGYVYYIRNAAGRRPARNGTYGYPAACDLLVVNLGLGDLANNGKVGANIYPGAFKTALRALARFASLSAFYGAEPAGASDPSMSFGAGWADGVATDKNTGTGFMFANAEAATVTITVPATFCGGEIDLFFMPVALFGSQNVYIEVTGATQYGRIASMASADVSDQVNTFNANYAAVPLTGLNPGAHTITATVRNTNLGLGFDGWGIRAPQPPNIVFCSQLKAPQAALDAFLGAFNADTPTPSTIDMLNGWIRDVAGEIPNVYYHQQPDVILDRAANTMDGVHPNDDGQLLTLRALRDTIASLPQIPAAPAPAPVGIDTAAFAANWSNYGDPYAAAQYTMLPGSRIQLAGRVKRTGTATPPETMFTLPVQHRPAKQTAFLLPSATATPARIQIATTGAVTYDNGGVGSEASIDLDQVSYTADTSGS